jgi:undecaprenyl-diphosphatase
MKQSLRRAFDWCTTDAAVLLTGLGILLGVWVFIAVAYVVGLGTSQAFDERLLLALRNPANPEDALGPKWLEDLCRDVTALGGVAALCLMTIAVAGYLVMARKFHALVFLAAATVGGLLLSGLLKQTFDRPRPSVVPHLSYVSTPSFPSGHSMLSAIVYLTLGALLARFVEERRLKIYFLGTALLLSFFVGLSRVYMGVHYPTDVLAGWSAGLTWALFCGLVARRLQQRGTVEGTAT